MKLAGKVAVITGASSGIGRALAVHLGLRGAKVAIAARSADKLRETAALLNAYGIEHIAVPFDVTSDPELLLTKVHEAFATVDIFVNNAGVGLFESFAESSSSDIDTLFRTNFWGPLNLMRHVIPTLRGGVLVTISSAAAKYAPYHQGIYAASKAALERVTEAVGIEEEKHLKTVLVVPDRTETPFMKNVVGPQENARLGLKLKSATAEQVAHRIVRAIETDKSLCYTTAKAWMYAVLSALFPNLVKNIIRKTIA